LRLNEVCEVNLGERVQRSKPFSRC